MLLNDFKSVEASNRRINNVNRNQSAFTVVLPKNKRRNNTKYSLAHASKPLIFCASLFSVKIIRYINNGIVKVKCLEKAYCLAFISGLAALMAFVTPASWQDTQPDVPLNILTKTFGLHHIMEVFVSLFIATFSNSGLYVKLFKKLDSIDAHFDISKNLYKRRVAISTVLTVLPFLQTSFTFWLRKFRIQNMSVHISFYLIMLQGSIICFFIFHIYVKCLDLNTLLRRKIKTIDRSKVLVLKDSRFDRFCKNLSNEPPIIANIDNEHSWFELMQIYDKICDCVDLFNNIYTGQVFIMFNSWLLCTLLIICRSLSPTVKYSNIILSDIFSYTSINIRPLMLAKMSELLMEQRKRTLQMLLHIITYDDLEYNEYIQQVETMIDLVETREWKISANVFTVDVSTVFNLAGRIISYTVLMIQYFYIHLFKK